MLNFKKYSKLPLHLINFFLIQKQAKVNFIRTRTRSFILIPELINKKIGIYNGKQYIIFIVKKQMLGHKVGEFSFTKRMGHLIHKGVIEKNKQKRNLLKKTKVSFKK